MIDYSSTFAICKLLYTRKSRKGLLSDTFVSQQKIFINLFLTYGEITEEEWMELIGILTGTEDETESDSDK